MKKWLAVVLLLVATATWCWRCVPGGAPSESQLRQTTGISAEVVGCRAAMQGMEVTCRVSNATSRTAARMVLNVGLSNAQGQTVAANPLAGVADVAAGLFRDAVFVVRTPAPQTQLRAHVEVSLVRWQE